MLEKRGRELDEAAEGDATPDVQPEHHYDFAGDAKIKSFEDGGDARIAIAVTCRDGRL